MTIAIVEDLPRKKRDAKMQRVIKQQDQLRELKYIEASGQSSLSAFNEQLNFPVTSKMDEISKEFQTLFSGKDDEKDEKDEDEIEGDDEIEGEYEGEEIDHEHKGEGEEVDSADINSWFDKSDDLGKQFLKDYGMAVVGSDVTYFLRNYMHLKSPENRYNKRFRDTTIGPRVIDGTFRPGSSITLSDIILRFFKTEEGLAINFQRRGIDEPITITPFLFYLLFFNGPYFQYEKFIRRSGYDSYIKILTSWGGIKKLGPFTNFYRASYKMQKYMPIEDKEKLHIISRLTIERQETSPNPTKLKGKGVSPAIATEKIDKSTLTNKLKMDRDGNLGNIHIDVDKLRGKFKLVASKKTKVKINKKLTKSVASDLYDLLTKRFNRKQKYTSESLHLFEQLRNMSGCPTIAVHTAKKDIGSNSFQYFDDEDLQKKLELLISQRRAGNATPQIKTEITSIMDVMLKRNIIDHQDYGRVLQAMKNI